MLIEGRKAWGGGSWNGQEGGGSWGGWTGEGAPPSGDAAPATTTATATATATKTVVQQPTGSPQAAAAADNSNITVSDTAKSSTTEALPNHSSKTTSSSSHSSSHASSTPSSLQPQSTSPLPTPPSASSLSTTAAATTTLTHLPKGAIIGASLGSVILLLVVGYFLLACYIRRRRGRNNHLLAHQFTQLHSTQSMTELAINGASSLEPPLLPPKTKAQEIEAAQSSPLRLLRLSSISQASVRTVSPATSGTIPQPNVASFSPVLSNVGEEGTQSAEHVYHSDGGRIVVDIPPAYGEIPERQRQQHRALPVLPVPGLSDKDS